MKITVEVPMKCIENLLVSALEGGANYWYEISNKRKPKKYTFRTSETKIYPHIDYPLNPGGALMIKQHVDPDGPGARILDLTTIARGLQAMADSPLYKHHFSDILREDTDSTTGDVFLQLALYGDVLFG